MKQKYWNLRNLAKQVAAYEPAPPTNENILARHAVARIIFRVPFEGEPATHTHTHTHTHTPGESKAKLRRRMEREIMVLLASSILFHRDIYISEGQVDRFLRYDNIDEIWNRAEAICSTADEGYQFVRWLCLRTRNTLEDHIEPWDKVPAVEEAIKEHGTTAITEAEIRKILTSE